MPRPGLVPLPVHPGGGLIKDLHPVHADVLVAGLGVFGDDQRQRDKRAAVLGPALEHRQSRQIYLVATPDDLLHRAAAHAFGRQRSELSEFRQVRGEAEEPPAEFYVQEVANPVRNRVEAGGAERQRHPLPCSVEADSERKILADDVLEEESGATRFDHAVGDFGDLEVGRNRLCNAEEFTATLERGQEGSEVRVHMPFSIEGGA
jgi:hypothetical protein